MNIKKLLEKRKTERLLKKEETRLWKKLRDKADEVFSKFIRKRDIKKWCITKRIERCTNRIQHNCHWIGRGWYSHRWDELNCNWWCASCNTFNQEEHKVEYTRIMVNRHWIDWVEKQLFEKNKIKPSIDELIEIIKKYEKVL